MMKMESFVKRLQDPLLFLWPTQVQNWNWLKLQGDKHETTDLFSALP